MVEEEHRSDGDDEAQRGDDEGLGDAGRDGGDATTTGRGDALEGDDDADDGAEQADEGGGGADRGEHAHAATTLGAEELELAGELAPGDLGGGRDAALAALVGLEGLHADGGEARERVAGEATRELED